MKKIIALCTVAFVFCTASFAQKGGRFNQEMKQHLKDSLQLSDAQADSVTAIEQSFRPQMRDIMKDESLSKEDKKEKLQALKAGKKERLQAVLSQEQLTKLETMEKNMKHKMHNRDGVATPEKENK